MPALDKHIVLSFVAQDKPGIVERLAATIKQVEASWLESQLMHLGGLFSGLVSLTIQTHQLDELKRLLDALKNEGIDVHTIQTINTSNQDIAVQAKSLELIGPDRVGIVYEITNAMKEHGMNIETMETKVSSAPMSGEALFSAQLAFNEVNTLNKDALYETLDAIAEELTLDISFS